jgi:hypothetical protein
VLRTLRGPYDFVHGSHRTRKVLRIGDTVHRIADVHQRGPSFRFQNEKFTNNGSHLQNRPSNACPGVVMKDSKQSIQ